MLRGLAEGDSVVAGPYEAIRALEEGGPIRVMGQPSGKQPNPSKENR